MKIIFSNFHGQSSATSGHGNNVSISTVKGSEKNTLQDEINCLFYLKATEGLSHVRAFIARYARKGLGVDLKRRFGLKKIICMISLCLFTGSLYSTPGHSKNKNMIAQKNLRQIEVVGNRITDSSGRDLNVEKPFKRIVSLYGAHTENLFFLGLDQEIIGVSRNETYPEAAKKKPWFSYHDGPEKFLGAAPDLVLVRPMIERGYASLIHRLEKSGIAVISLQPADVSEMLIYWRALGVLTGKHGKAEQMISDFKKQITYFEKLIDHVDMAHRKKVYFEAIHSKMKTFTPGAMALFALKTAGGINIATDAIASRGTNIGNYGKERILSHAHEIDIYLAQYGVMNNTSIKKIKEEPGFGIIKAVKNNQIYLIDEMIVSRPSFRLLKGVETIGSILYPKHYGKHPEEKETNHE